MALVNMTYSNMTLEVRSSVWKKGKRLIQNYDIVIVTLNYIVLILMFVSLANFD